jgi:hypothetical protein
MVTPDRIRLTGLLQTSPAPAGFVHSSAEGSAVKPVSPPVAPELGAQHHLEGGAPARL